MNSLLDKFIKYLVCPESKQKLFYYKQEDLQNNILLGKDFNIGISHLSKFSGKTDIMLVREDQQCAYSIIDDIPILLAPEMFTFPGFDRTFDLKESKYSESYEEMPVYNKIAGEKQKNEINSRFYKDIKNILQIPEKERITFPRPIKTWLDADYDSAAQFDCYKHISPLRGKRILQLGGSGIHAIKFLLGGADECWLITPSLKEIKYAVSLAEYAGVKDRLYCVMGIAEELPFMAGFFDAIYSGGSIHHTVTSYSFSESARVLRDGGKFGAADPFRTITYTIGTSIFGKRGVDGANCTPLTKKRLQPFYDSYKKLRITHHGALLRYPLLVLRKIGISFKLITIWRLNYLDDRFCSLIPGLRKLGGSISILGTK